MYWSSSSGRIELQMTLKQAESASHQGQCDADVKALSEIPAIKRQIDKLAPDTIANELREYGAWDEEELKDYKQNIQRLLWIAAGDITEEAFMKGSK